MTEATAPASEHDHSVLHCPACGVDAKSFAMRSIFANGDAVEWSLRAYCEKTPSLNGIELVVPEQPSYDYEKIGLAFQSAFERQGIALRQSVSFTVTPNQKVQGLREFLGVASR